MSDASVGEQRGAGLDRLTPEEYARLQRLNGDYRRRFGFPFLFAVKGSTKEDVLTALEARVGRSEDAEFAEALRQVYRIARFRLEDVMGDAWSDWLADRTTTTTARPTSWCTGSLRDGGAPDRTQSRLRRQREDADLGRRVLADLPTRRQHGTHRHRFDEELHPA